MVILFLELGPRSGLSRCEGLWFCIPQVLLFACHEPDGASRAVFAEKLWVAALKTGFAQVEIVLAAVKARLTVGMVDTGRQIGLLARLRVRPSERELPLPRR